MKNIPYEFDRPLLRVEKGDIVEISVTHFPQSIVREKDIKKYGHMLTVMFVSIHHWIISRYPYQIKTRLMTIMKTMRISCPIKSMNMITIGCIIVSYQRKKRRNMM